MKTKGSKNNFLFKTWSYYVALTIIQYVDQLGLELTGRFSLPMLGLKVYTTTHTTKQKS